MQKTLRDLVVVVMGLSVIYWFAVYYTTEWSYLVTKGFIQPSYSWLEVVGLLSIGHFVAVTVVAIPVAVFLGLLLKAHLFSKGLLVSLPSASYLLYSANEWGILSGNQASAWVTGKDVVVLLLSVPIWSLLVQRYASNN